MQAEYTCASNTVSHNGKVSLCCTRESKISVWVLDLICPGDPTGPSGGRTLSRSFGLVCLAHLTVLPILLSPRPTRPHDEAGPDSAILTARCVGPTQPLTVALSNSLHPFIQSTQMFGWKGLLDIFCFPIYDTVKSIMLQLLWSFKLKKLFFFSSSQLSCEA